MFADFKNFFTFRSRCKMFILHAKSYCSNRHSSHQIFNLDAFLHCFLVISTEFDFCKFLQSFKILILIILRNVITKLVAELLFVNEFEFAKLLVRSFVDCFYEVQNAFSFSVFAIRLFINSKL